MKNNKVRYCRFCKKVLDKDHMFFCSDECMERFEEDYTSLEDIDKALEKIHMWTEEVGTVPKDTMLDKCKECKKDCKIFVGKDYINTIISFECFDFEKIK